MISKRVIVSTDIIAFTQTILNSHCHGSNPHIAKPAFYLLILILMADFKSKIVNRINDLIDSVG